METINTTHVPTQTEKDEIANTISELFKEGTTNTFPPIEKLKGVK